MNTSNSLEGIRVRSIFHPSDFSEASEIAFVHALKIALVAKANLSMLHVAADPHLQRPHFPAIRDTLARWRILPPDSPEEAVEQLGIEVRKVVTSSSHPVEASLRYLGKHPADLLVLAVHQHQGRMHWLEKPIGKPIARAAGQMTLFIPHGVEGFIARQDGTVSLRNILIPVTVNPFPGPAVETAARLIYNLQLPAGTVTLLHAGALGDGPLISLPEGTGWTWNRVTQSGEPAETILQTAVDLGADLIVMTSEGPNSLLDSLQGSTFERVLRNTRCPVVNLPVGATPG